MSNIYNIYQHLINDGVSDDIKSEIKSATFYKYLNLYKKAGFSVIKSKNLYKIVRYTNSTKLSDAETGLIAYLELLAYTYFPKTKNRVFLKLIDKLLKFTSEETENSVTEKFEQMKKISTTNFYKEKLELFENYKNKKSVVFVTLKNGEKYSLQPDEIVFKNKKIYFNFIDNINHEIKQFDINKIVNITPKTDYSPLRANSKEIIFELYGRLSKIYLLKEGERIVDSSSDKLTIANCASDKKNLFKRLLRYDTLCKIKFPKRDSLEFEKLIEKSLENIDSIKDNIYEEDIN